MWTDFVPVEESAMDQLKNTAELPFLFKKCLLSILIVGILNLE